MKKILLKIEKEMTQTHEMLENARYENNEREKQQKWVADFFH